MPTSKPVIGVELTRKHASDEIVLDAHQVNAGRCVFALLSFFVSSHTPGDGGGRPVVREGGRS